MGTYKFKITVKPIIEMPKPWVQVFVDTNHDQYFSLNEEVALTDAKDEATGTYTWECSMALPATPNGPGFMVSLTMAVGSNWQVVIEDSTGHVTFDTKEKVAKKTAIALTWVMWGNP